MKREKKIELLRGIAEGTNNILDLQEYIFLIEKEGKKYLTDLNVIIREISDAELDKIKAIKLVFPEEFLGL